MHKLNYIFDVTLLQHSIGYMDNMAAIAVV